MITSQPVSQSVALGETATFLVSADGPGLVYTWFCNGGALAGQNGPTLRVTNVKPENVGLYFAQIIDQSGRVVTQTDFARLTIPSPDLVITSGPENQRVLLGTEAAFFVTATGSGPLSYQWMRNGTAISGATQARLAIPGTLEVNAGSYVVRVSTPSAAILSQTADLIYSIESSVSLVTPPLSQGAFRNGNARFEVTATGRGSLSYVWRHHSTKIAAATDAFLNLANVQPADAGEYWVTVKSSDGGVANASAVLTVFWLDIAPISNVTVKEGSASAPVAITLAGDAQSLDNATLTATSSNPGLISSDDILFGGAGAGRFMIVLAKPNSSGIARVKVTASDRGQSAATDVTISIAGANTPPVILSLPPSLSAVLGQIVTIPFQVSDNETDTAALQVEARLIGSSHSGMVQVVGNQSERLLVVKAESSEANRLSCLVSVRDGSGATTEQIISILLAGPSLRISQDGPELVIAYTDSAPAGVVEYRYGLSPTEPWRTVGYLPVSVGGLKVMKIPIPINSTFFRLRF